MPLALLYYPIASTGQLQIDHGAIKSFNEKNPSQAAAIASGIRGCSQPVLCCGWQLNSNMHSNMYTRVCTCVRVYHTYTHITYVHWHRLDQLFWYQVEKCLNSGTVAFQKCSDFRRQFKSTTVSASSRASRAALRSSKRWRLGCRSCAWELNDKQKYAQRYHCHYGTAPFAW